MLQQLIDARGRYQRMLHALSAGNPVDLELRRELQGAVDAIDAKLALASALGKGPSPASDVRSGSPR